MEVSTPKVSVRSGISLVWIIPLVTALVGGWLIIKTVSEQGPVATISFLTGDGIEAGTTRIKYKNVNIGVVDSMEFSEDFSHVILTAEFNKGTESFLRRNTRFWVVRPQLVSAVYPGWIRWCRVPISRLSRGRARHNCILSDWKNRRSCCQRVSVSA